MKYDFISISVLLLFCKNLIDLYILHMPNTPKDIIIAGAEPVGYGLWFGMNKYHHNLANTFEDSNNRHWFNKDLLHKSLEGSDEFHTSFDYQDNNQIDDIKQFKSYLDGNIEEINVTELLKEKRYRDPKYQPGCVDSRQSNNVIQVPGGMLLLYESCLAGIKRWLGAIDKNPYIDEKERDVYRNFISSQSDKFLQDKPYLWCHCSDKYCEHNKQSDYDKVNHIWCGALNFFVDDSQSNYDEVLQQLKSTPQDVAYMRSLIKWSYDKGGIKTLEGSYNADGFLYIEPVLHNKNGDTYAKSIKNNKNNNQEFFVYDSVLTELVAEDITNDLSKQIWEEMDSKTQHIVEKIVEYGFENPDNKLIIDIADDHDMSVYQKFLLLNRYKTLKTLRARIKYIATNLQPVVDVISKNEDKQTLFHIEL